MPWWPRERSGVAFQRQAILIFRLLEETGRPESVAVQCGRLGIGRRDRDELQRLGARDVEFGHAQRRLHDTGSRGARIRRHGGGERLLKGLERILVTSVRQKLATELKLNLARLGLRRASALMVSDAATMRPATAAARMPLRMEPPDQTQQAGCPFKNRAGVRFRPRRIPYCAELSKSEKTVENRKLRDRVSACSARLARRRTSRRPGGSECRGYSSPARSPRS